MPCFGQTYDEKISGVDCFDPGIQILGSDSILQESGMLVLQSARNSQEILLGLIVKYPVYLRSGNEKVYLKLMETLLGDVYTTQVVLKPIKRIQKEKIYELIIDSLPQRDNLSGNNSLSRMRIVPFASMDMVVWPSMPEKLYYQCSIPPCHEDIFFRCKNRELVSFSLPVGLPGGTLIRAEIENLKTGKKVCQYIQANENHFELGHSECFGNFEFGKNQSFQGRFDILLPNGSSISWKGELVKFHTNLKQEECCQLD